MEPPQGMSQLSSSIGKQILRTRDIIVCLCKEVQRQPMHVVMKLEENYHTLRFPSPIDSLNYL